MNPTKIYLSGPDGAGKSTAAKALEELGYKIMKWSKPLPDEDYIKKAVSQLTDPEMMVLDRGWFGDLIYCQVFKTKPVITKADAIQLLKDFIKQGHMLIYMKATPSKLAERVLVRGDAFINIADIPLICRLYDEWFDELRIIHKIPYTVIDTTNLF